MATTLRDLGLEPGDPTALAPQAPTTLRSLGLTPTVGPDVAQYVDQASANSMGQLRKSFTSNRFGNEANNLAAEESGLRASGQTQAADALRGQITGLQERAATFAPDEQDITKIGLTEPGRLLDYTLGATGGLASSVVDPIAASATLGGAGRLIGMIPHPAAQFVGRGLQLAAPLAAYGINARNMKGEFYNDAVQNEKLMAERTPQEIDTAGNVYGGVAGLADTVLPHAIGGRLIGKPGLKALSKLGLGTKTLIDSAGEGLTEIGQEVGKKYTLGKLDPTRDTSGDMNDYINSGAAALLGSPGMSLPSHMIAKGHARTLVKDDGEVGDLLGKTQEGTKTPAKQTLTESLAAGAQKPSSADAQAFRDLLNGIPAAGGDAAGAIPAQHAALVKELGARAASDPVAQQHLDTLLAQNPNDISAFEPDAETARIDAATHLIGDGISEESDQRLIDAYAARKRNTQVSPSDLGAGKTGGATPLRMDPQVAIDRANIEQRGKLTASILRDAVPEGRKPQIASIASDLGHEIAQFAGTDFGKPTRGDVARTARIGAQLVSIYGGQADKVLADIGDAANINGTPLFKALSGHVALASEDHSAYQQGQALNRKAAAKQLVAAIPPQAQLKLRKAGVDFTNEGGREALLHEVERYFDDESTRSSLDFTSTFGKDAVEQMREIVGQRIAPRPKAMEEKPVLVRSQDEGADFEKLMAEKNVTKAPGTKQYAFNKKQALASSADAAHPFQADKKSGRLPELVSVDATNHDGTNTLQALEAKTHDALGLDLTGATKTVTRAPGITKQITSNPDRLGGTRIRSVSAKSVMDDAGVAPSKRVALLRDYLHQDGVLDKSDPALGQLGTLDKRIAAAEQATPKMKIDGGLKENPEHVALQDLKGQRTEVVAKLADRMGVETDENTSLKDLADRYFADRHLVVAEQMGEKDGMRMTPAEVASLAKRGAKDLQFSDKAGEGKAAMQADMNLIHFKSPQATTKSGVSTMRASEIVAWVRKNRTDYNDTRQDSNTKALNFRNDLMESIGALRADGYMSELPYMIGADGKEHSFKDGFPAVLKLSTKTQHDLNVERQKRAERKAQAEPFVGPSDEEAVAREQNKGEEAADAFTEASTEGNNGERGEGGQQEETAQRTAVTNMAVEQPPALNRLNAMRKGTDYAATLRRDYLADPKAGMERINRVARALIAPETVRGESNAVVGGRFYAAPLAMLLTPEFVGTDKRLTMLRSAVADSLAKAGATLSTANVTTLARSLASNEKMSASAAMNYLHETAQAYRDGKKAQAARAAMNPKAEPLPSKAPAVETDGTKRNTQTQSTPEAAQSAANAAPKDDAIAKARAYVTKVLGPNVKVEFSKAMKNAGEWIKSDDLIRLALNTGPGLETVAHHEALHAFWSRYAENNPEVARVLTKTFSDPDMVARMNAIFHDEPSVLRQLTADPEERVAYGYQLWVAGQLDVDKPATTVFDKFRKLLRKVFGMVRDSETALDIMTAFHEGKLADTDAGSAVINRLLKEAAFTKDMKRNFDKTIQGLHSLVAPSNDMLRNQDDSVTAKALAYKLFTNPGEFASGKFQEGYLNARRRVVSQYTNYLYAGLKGLSQRDMEAASDHLQRETELKDIPYAPVQKAVKDMRALTARYHTYATSAGMTLEYLGDKYHPRVWDMNRLINEKEAFTTMLLQSKYAKNFGTALALINTDPNRPAVTREQLADMLHHQLVEKNGVDEKGMDADRGNEVISPFFANEKERHFKWLDKNDVAPFLEKDLVGAMSRYLHQGIRAAEYTKRFGRGGKDLRELLAMKGDVWENPKTGLKEPRPDNGKIAAELVASAERQGIRGKEGDEWVARRMEDYKNSVAAHEGSLGSDISPTFRKVSSAAMAYQNMRLLPMSLFAAFADVAGIASRGGGGKAAFDAFGQGLRDVFSRWKDAASDMPAARQKSTWDGIAEMIGAVDSHMFLEQIGKAHTSEFMTDFARNANRKLFMANGLTAWDRSMRVSATKAGVLFIQDHAGLPDKKNSERWLNELGLTAQTVPLDASGGLITDRHVLAAAKGISLEDASKQMEAVHYALTRFVEGAVMSPNAGQRPTWASDPRYGVLFHLKQFTYSFQHVLIKRALHEASEGNMNPIGALAAAVPTMIASDMVKGLVVGGGDWPAYMKAWSGADWIAHGVSRAGLGGVGQFGVDALSNPVSLFGPTVEQAVHVVMNPLDIGQSLHDAAPIARMIKGLPDLTRAVE